GYSVLIPLGLDEVAAYARHGRPFLNQIAHDIQNAGPGSVLQRRDVSAEFAQVCSAAIQEWIERDIGAT
ncbi:MAG TPA: hypothetical protein PLX06_12195, partial [Fimbriimonadaceae bacterium]|nr:hypothetical protein [Fimbriimonadaceae bacterium]